MLCIQISQDDSQWPMADLIKVLSLLYENFRHVTYNAVTLQHVYVLEKWFLQENNKFISFTLSFAQTQKYSSTVWRYYQEILSSDFTTRFYSQFVPCLWLAVQEHCAQYSKEILLWLLHTETKYKQHQLTYSLLWQYEYYLNVLVCYSLIDNLLSLHCLNSQPQHFLH